MELKPMYPAQKDSPSTFLLGDISAVDVLLVVGNAAIIPQTVPFPLTIGINRTITETVMVTTINLENNQLTVTRGNPAYDWPAGTTCARVFTAKNLNDLQDNVGDIGENLTTVQETVATHNTDISALKTTVGGADSGLVKGLADEIVRAEAAEGAEVTRATGVEAGLNTAKINRTELAQVITDWVYSADGTKVLVTITRYNASTQQTTEYTRTIPVVSNATMGVMTPEAYNEIASLRNDVNALINLGGRFIGVSFATKVALDEYVVPASVKTGDFTYVIDDETKDGATTRYVRNGSVWDFTFVIDYDPVGLADDETAGLVKSTDGTVFGKIFVETDGTMSLVGWDETLNDVLYWANDNGDYVEGTLPLDADLLGGEPASYYKSKINDLLSDVGDVQDEVTAHKAEEASDTVLGHVKVDGTTINIDGDGVISGAGFIWTTVSVFTRVSNSTYTVTDNATNQAIHCKGRPIRYADTLGTYSYGIITGYTTGTVTLAGAPMTTSFDAILEYGDMNRVVQVDVMIPSSFASGGANSTLINTWLKTNLLWRYGTAYLVRFGIIVDVDDSGANQTIVNVNVAGSAVSTSNTNAGLSIAETWVYTTTDINTTNYSIAMDEEIELVCDATGTNNNATDLTVSMSFSLV